MAKDILLDPEHLLTSDNFSKLSVEIINKLFTNDFITFTG